VGGGGSSPGLLADGKGGKIGTAAASSDEVGAPVAGGVLRWGGEEEEAQAQVYPEKKAARGCSGLRSPWRGSRRRRRSDNGGGMLGQRHDTQTAMWSASDMGDGAVGTGAHEARRGRRRQRGGVSGHWPVETAFNPHACVRTVLPTASNQGVARGDTATDSWPPHVSVFSN
jgi:hypothetical protein